MSARNLAVRILFQSALVPVVFAAIAFAAAGTVVFWQAWVYAAVFLAAVLAIVVHFLARDPALMERRLKAGEVGESSSTQRAIQAVAGPAFFAIFVVGGLDRRWGWSHASMAIALAGDVVVAIGFGIVFFVFRENTFTSSVIEAVPGQRVVSTGPYRVVRHPMYSGALLVILATPLALGSLWAMVLVAPLVALVVARLLDEERFLAKNLAGYEDYVRATRYRLLPRVW
jgi:protein-S-isoprenylcysteine O-methyltransferase Ste14